MIPAKKNFLAHFHLKKSIISDCFENYGKKSPSVENSSHEYPPPPRPPPSRKMLPQKVPSG